MIDPNNRREVFLNAIATGRECSLEPVTREEILLAGHARREANGGSGGGSVSTGGSTGSGVFVFAPNFVYDEELEYSVYRVKDEDRVAVINAVKNMCRIYAAYNANSYGNWSNYCYELQFRLSANHLPNDDGDEEESNWALEFRFVEYEERNMSHNFERIRLTREEYHEIYDAWNAMSNNAFLRPADAGMSGGGTHG